MSVPAELEAEEILRVELMDKTRDEAWERKMNMKSKALEWDLKTKRQEQGSRLMDGLRDPALDPLLPDYASRAAKLIAENPLGAADERVQAFLKTNDDVFKQAETQRTHAASLADTRETDRIDREAKAVMGREKDAAEAEAAKAKQGFDLDQDIKKKLYEMPKEARDAFHEAVKSGADPYEALGAANDISRTYVTHKEAALAQSSLKTLTAQIEAANKALKEETKATNMSPDPARQKALRDQIDALQKEIAPQQGIVEAYHNRTIAKKPGAAGDSGSPKPAPAPEGADQALLDQIKQATDWLDKNPNHEKTAETRARVEALRKKAGSKITL